MVSYTLLSTRVSMRNMDVVDEVCRSAARCGGVDHSTMALLLLTVLFGLLVLVALVHVREATSILEEERARLVAERDAFDAFARRVANMDVSEATAAVTATGSMVQTGGNRDGLADVASAYRDTVMGVGHYEADYGEPMAANLAAELGDDLALAVLDGRILTPQLQSALLAASHEASRNRTAFLSTITAEAEALDEAGAALREIDDERASVAAAPLNDRSYDELTDDWHRLGGLVDRCRALVSDRQEGLRSRSNVPADDESGLQDYLYGEFAIPSPVLADAAAVVGEIEALRGRLLRALTRRV